MEMVVHHYSWNKQFRVAIGVFDSVRTAYVKFDLPLLLILPYLRHKHNYICNLDLEYLMFFQLLKYWNTQILKYSNTELFSYPSYGGALESTCGGG